MYASGCFWDDGYPSGGNYWSDYNGTDLYNGPYQNELGSDLIGDTPYPIRPDIIGGQNQDNYPLVRHDLAVVDVTTSKDGCLPVPVIGQGYSLQVNVTVKNQGNLEESFNVTAYINTTLIGEQEATLLPAENRTLMFLWNTTGFARAYTISANATILLNETNNEDNTYVSDTIRVSCIGDINGDYVTDAKDYQLVKNAIPSMPGSSNWNPNADVNGDGVIGVKDYQIVKSHIPSQLP
jgi:hypothetical protein